MGSRVARPEYIRYRTLWMLLPLAYSWILAQPCEYRLQCVYRTVQALAVADTTDVYRTICQDIGLEASARLTQSSSTWRPTVGLSSTVNLWAHFYRVNHVVLGISHFIDPHCHPVLEAESDSFLSSSGFYQSLRLIIALETWCSGGLSTTATPSRSQPDEQAAQGFPFPHKVSLEGVDGGWVMRVRSESVSWEPTDGGRQVPCLVGPSLSLVLVL